MKNMAGNVHTDESADNSNRCSCDMLRAERCVAIV